MVQSFAQYHPHHSRSCEGQGHRLRIFMLNFTSKFFGPHYIFFYFSDIQANYPVWRQVLFCLSFAFYADVSKNA